MTLPALSSDKAGTYLWALSVTFFRIPPLTWLACLEVSFFLARLLIAFFGAMVCSSSSVESVVPDAYSWTDSSLPRATPGPTARLLTEELLPPASLGLLTRREILEPDDLVGLPGGCRFG